MPTVVTLDLGTTVTKAVLVDVEGGRAAVAGVGRAEVAVDHPRPGWAEQDPGRLFDAVADACRAMLGRRRPPAIDAVACSAARQSLVLLDRRGRPLGPVIVWSDARAGPEAATLAAERGGAEAWHAATGVMLDGRSVAAKCRWLSHHHRALWSSTARLASPRDLVVERLCGEVVTDWTLASASGLYEVGGDLVVGELAGRLAPPVASDTVVGHLRSDAAAALGLQTGVPVVVGAGDRACEVLGTAASPSWPMVSWGTTANASVPLSGPPVVPPGLTVTRGALGGWVAEAGLAAAGSLLSWLGGMVGRSAAEMMALAADAPPGALGVAVTPWLNGARAPWWEPAASAAVVGLHHGHTLADIARAAVEGVASDLVVSLGELGSATGVVPEGLALAAGADLEPWVEVITGICGLPARRRASGLAASMGAARLALSALGEPVDAEGFDPTVEERRAPLEVVEEYRAWKPRREQLSRALLALFPPGTAQAR